MNPLLPFARDQLLQRNAHRVALLFLVTAILVTPFYFYLALQTGSWQLFALAGSVVMLDVASAVSVRLIRRQRATRGVGLLVLSILVLLLIASALISRLGVAAGLIAVIVTLAIATQTLPPQTLNRALLASVLAAVGAGFLDLWAPSFQFVVPGIRTLTLIVAALLVLVFSVVITRQFRAYHLSTKLIIIFLLFTLVPIGLLALLENRANRTALTQNANQALLAAANQTASDLDTFIQTNLNLVQAEAQLPIFTAYLNLPADRRGGSAAESQALATLQVLKSRDANILSYALLDRDGHILISTFAPDTGRDSSGYSYFQMPLPSAANRPYVSPVLFLPQSDEPALFFSSPTSDTAASPPGLLLVHYNATVLQQIVSRSNGRAGPDSFAVLFDENFAQLAHGMAPETTFRLITPLESSRLAQLQAEGRVPNEPVDRLLLPLPLLAENLASVDAAPFFTAEDVGDGRTGIRDSATGDQLNQAVATRLASQPWLVAFFQPQDVFLAPGARQVQVTILLSVIIAGVVAAGTIGVSQRLTAPIVHLTEVADKITRGDLTVQARVATSDEIGALAFTFNVMTGQIRDLINTLEQRVADRTRALATSTEVSRRLSTILDQRQLVKEVVEQVQTAFDYYHVHIYLFDEDDENLIMVGGTGEAGRAMLAAGHTLPKGKGLVGRAGATNAVVFVPDVSREMAWLPNPLLPDTRAEAAVPIAIGSGVADGRHPPTARVLGVLDVQHNVLNGLQQQDVELLQSIANQVAVALRNAQLFGQVQQQSQELALINRVVSSVAASMDLQQSMQIIATELAQALAVEQTGIALINPDGKGLTVVAEHFDETSSSSALGLVIPIEGNTLTEQVLATRRPVIVTDAQHNPLTSPVHEIMRRRQVQTLIILPMIAGDAVIGTVGIDSLKENHVFAPEQLRLAETIIFQAAAAVQNARLFEQTQAALAETQRRSRELALINEVVAAVAASLDLQASLDTICARLAQAVNVQQVRIALLNADRTRLAVVAEHYDQSNSSSALGFVIPVAGNLLTEQVLQTRRPVVVSDAQHNPITAPVHEGMRQQGIESLVVLPILAGNEVIGTVGIDILEKNRILAADELTLVETIVFQVATAVQNAHLFQQTEAKARELAVINQVAQAVSQQLELDHLLNSVYEQIGRVMPVDAFMVALYDAKDQSVHYPFVYDSGQRYQHPPSPLSPNFKLHQVILEGQPLRLNRTQEEVAQGQAQSPQALVGDNQKISASLLYVPLHLGSQTVGALSVQSYDYNAYGQADVAILSGIANHVAVALENSQLFEQTQAALAETDLLYQASARLNAAQSYDDVLSTLRQHTYLGQQAHIAHLARFDRPWTDGDEPGWLDVIAHWSASSEDGFVGRYRLADTAAINQLHSGRPILIEDLANDSRVGALREAPLLSRLAIQSGILVPLLVGKQWTGTIALFYQQATDTLPQRPLANAFPEREVRHLSALASQAAITMQTIHLLEETNRLLASEQRQRLIADTLLKAASRMSESLSESELRRIMVDQICDILLPDHVNLYEWVESDNSLRLDLRLAPGGTVESGEGTPGEGTSPHPGDTYRQGQRIKPEERPDLWQVLSQNTPLLQAQESDDGFRREHYRLPWLVGTRPFGVIELFQTTARSVTISEEDKARCQGIVRQAAIALQNARSYEQEQARARREKVLREIAARVRGSADVDTIMRTAVQEVGQALGRRTFLYLDNDNNGKTEAQ